MNSTYVTFKNLADEIGVSASTARKYLMPNKTVNQATASVLSYAFGVPVEEFASPVELVGYPDE